ncbi:MAG: hypothetical protein COZ18_09890 [Flexibacter sp. CG_4_10_14_3_um_filter_32_15]|nr:MAG: hypothetical protein COZ18_09890 [Flexibacter sp. CG_4_10_14_3_um_filter_32_15]
MKAIKFSIFAFLFLISLSTFAQKEGQANDMSEEEEKLELPRKSSISTLIQEIGLTEFFVRYSRPSVKGRKKHIWGELVPYRKVWRAGANEATTIEFSSDVKINGKPLKKGKYAIFVIPQKKGDWTFIFNTAVDSWGKEAYNEANDVLRVNATVEKSKFQETLAYDFDKIVENEATFILRWECKLARITIQVNTVEEAKKNIAAAISKYPNDWQVLVRSAGYYKNEKIELRQALEWANQAIKLKNDHYLPYWVKSEILALESDYKGAVENAQKALEVGKDDANFIYAQTIQAQIDNWLLKVN